MNGSDPSTTTLPRQFHLRGQMYEFGHLESRHKAALLDFARQLPEEDLLFLDRDIAQTAVVDRWLTDVAAGDLLTIVASCNDQLVGYATVYQGAARWTRHVAELRAVVAESVRGSGLGRLLLELAFELSLVNGAQKVIARMTPDQQRARRLFERLGFGEEATLRNHALDANDVAHDLVILSYHVRRTDEYRCGDCGVPVLSALTLNGVSLCTQCYEAHYEELGGCG